MVLKHLSSVLILLVCMLPETRGITIEHYHGSLVVNSFQTHYDLKHLTTHHITKLYTQGQSFGLSGGLEFSAISIFNPEIEIEYFIGKSRISGRDSTLRYLQRNIVNRGISISPFLYYLPDEKNVGAGFGILFWHLTENPKVPSEEYLLNSKEKKFKVTPQVALRYIFYNQRMHLNLNIGVNLSSLKLAVRF